MATDHSELTSAEVHDIAEAWPVHSTADLYRGGAPFAVRRDEVSAPGLPEDTFGRIVVEHPGAVVILAVDAAERALVLKQYRHPAGIRFLELPAGLIDPGDDDPVLAAQRELLEEGAFVADEWIHLNTLYTSPGLSAERIETYLARGLTAVPDRGGFELVHEEADMTVHWVPMAELLTAVLERRITDGPLITAVLTYRVLTGQSPAGAPRIEAQA